MLLVRIPLQYFIMRHVRKCLACYWQPFILALVNLRIKSASDLLSYVSKYQMHVVSVDADFCGCCLWEGEQVFFLGVGGV